VQKIKFVGVVVFEKKMFEAKIDSYTYQRPLHKYRRNLFIFLQDYAHKNTNK
jgi:hypothetical protein